MITFKEQFDKLTAAYIHGKVRASDPCACFIGNMLNNTWLWSTRRNLDKSVSPTKWSPINHDELEAEYGFYSTQELCDLENNFMTFRHRNKEQDLFLAFESTLELLKQIHIAHGEIIDETPTFVKRELAWNS